MKPVKKITISAIVIALYIAVMFVTQGFAFGQYQIRIATSLYSLSYVYPFLILPMGLANFLSNTLMGGLGPLDMFGGTIAGIVTAGAVYLVRKFKLNIWLITIPIVLGPGLLVPVWLSVLLHVPYLPLALSICAGQVLPAIGGVLIIRWAGRYISNSGKNTNGCEM